jgi:membrane protein YdbS with pleckstrin-like domain
VAERGVFERKKLMLVHCRFFTTNRAMSVTILGVEWQLWALAAIGALASVVHIVITTIIVYHTWKLCKRLDARKRVPWHNVPHSKDE